MLLVCRTFSQAQISNFLYVCEIMSIFYDLQIRAQAPNEDAMLPLLEPNTNSTFKHKEMIDSSIIYHIIKDHQN